MNEQPCLIYFKCPELTQLCSREDMGIPEIQGCILREDTTRNQTIIWRFQRPKVWCPTPTESQYKVYKDASVILNMDINPDFQKSSESGFQELNTPTTGARFLKRFCSPFRHQNKGSFLLSAQPLATPLVTNLANLQHPMFSALEKSSQLFQCLNGNLAPVTGAELFIVIYESGVERDQLKSCLRIITSFTSDFVKCTHHWGI